MRFFKNGPKIRHQQAGEPEDESTGALRLLDFSAPLLESFGQLHGHFPQVAGCGYVELGLEVPKQAKQVPTARTSLRRP